jgi:quercetin dioxygenase-like cupin family protein
MDEPGTVDLRQHLEGLLLAEGLAPGAWSNAPGDRYADHRHDYDKVLAVASGAIEFHLRELGETVLLLAGDRLELPAGTLHAASVGAGGVTCLEAHLQRGALRQGLRRIPRWGTVAPGPGIDPRPAGETAPAGST